MAFIRRFGAVGSKAAFFLAGPFVTGLHLSHTVHLSTCLSPFSTVPYHHIAVQMRSLYLVVLLSVLWLATTRALSLQSRRKLLQTSSAIGVLLPSWRPANAYTPDPDPLQEALYLISRVQEATVLQERYINKASPPLQKMKLTLRLVDRSYRLLDQVTLVSQYMDNDNLVAAAQVGNEAADRLQEAIDFVYGFKQDASAVTPAQKEFVTSALRDTRELLFQFVDYLPDQSKLSNARHRVEEENKLNKVRDARSSSSETFCNNGSIQTNAGHAVSGGIRPRFGQRCRCFHSCCFTLAGSSYWLSQKANYGR